jgi:hypothetical protein
MGELARAKWQNHQVGRGAWPGQTVLGLRRRKSFGSVDLIAVQCLVTNRFELSAYPSFSS